MQAQAYTTTTSLDVSKSQAAPVVDPSEIAQILAEKAKDSVLPFAAVRAFFEADKLADGFVQKTAIQDWAKVMQILLKDGVVLGTEAGILANTQRIENHEKRLGIYLADLGIVPEEANDEDLYNLPMCAKEADIFFEMDAAFLTLEWCLYTTSLVEGFVRRNEPEVADQKDPQFIAEMYAQFIAKSQAAEVTEHSAWLHTLKWMGFQRLSPTAKMSVVNADDKVALAHLVAEIKKARTTDADNLAELEFCALSNLRAQISAPIEQLESIASELMDQWSTARGALWVQLLDATIEDEKTNTHLHTMRDVARETIDATLEKFHLDFDEWVLLQGLIAINLETIKRCRERLVATYEKDIAEFAALFCEENTNPTELIDHAFAIANELVENYNPRGCTSFGCLLQQEFDEISQPFLPAEA
jgi:hypothetical protein